MTNKYTRGDLEDLVLSAIEGSREYYGPDNDLALANEVLTGLFAEGIFDPNQVEGA